MSFKIGEKVIVKSSRTSEDAVKGIVRDLKWGMAFVEFQAGNREWIYLKRIHHDTSST